MGLLDRVVGRRAGADAAPRPPDAHVRSLTERLDALEALVEALQDSVDRQAKRHDERLSELARQLQPEELARVLSDDARRRGL